MATKDTGLWQWIVIRGKMEGNWGFRALRTAHMSPKKIKTTCMANRKYLSGWLSFKSNKES
jgi:hypothetical protein